MSLIKCPECGKVFSDRAAHCPQCGLPTSDALKAIVDDPTASPQPPSPQPPSPQPSSNEPQHSPYPSDYRFVGAKKPNSALLYTLICVVIVLAIVVIALLVHDKFGSNNQNADSADSITTVKELPADTIATPSPEEKPLKTKIETPPVPEEIEEIPDAGETEEITAPPASTPGSPQQTSPTQQTPPTETTNNETPHQ